MPRQHALLRSNAKISDLIYVTGTIGDAGLALQYLKHALPLKPEYQSYVLERLNRPLPRISFAKHLLGLAHAAIDISDGLAADLTHILEASKVGARVYLDQLPLSDALTQSVSYDDALSLALTSGDDYELCFTLPAHKKAEFENALSTVACRYTCIGEITAQPGLKLIDKNGNEYHGSVLGYQHF